MPTITQVEPNTIYSPSTQPGEWCTGCGCNNSRRCVQPNPDTLVIPTRFGNITIASRTYTFRPNFIHVLDNALHAQIALRENLARKPSQAEIRTMRLIKA